MHGPDHHLHEQHLKSSEFITDIVIGMSDGLTVPFALAAVLLLLQQRVSLKLLQVQLPWVLVAI
ncbi:MAG: hypothetical protein RL127_493 [Bacteroidota bacterium]